MRNLHVLLVSPTWPPDKALNGITTYVGQVARALSALGVRVSILSIEPVPPASKAQGVYSVAERPTSHRLRGLFKRFFMRRNHTHDVFAFGDEIARAVGEVNRLDPIDVIEMEESFGWFARVQQKTKIPVVVKLHGPAFLSFVGRAKEESFSKTQIIREGQSLKEARYLTSPAQATLTDTVNFYSLTPAVAEVVPNPISADSNAPLWQSERRKIPTLLFVGRFDERKGGDFAVAAFHALVKRHPRAKLQFVGPDIGIAAPSGNKLGVEQYVAQLFGSNWRAHIEIYGPLDQERVTQMRAKADVILICSRWENQPNTALEAMLQGCPVVAAKAGAIQETISHGVTGLLYEPDDIESFCSEVEKVLLDSTFAEQLGRAARAEVLLRHAPHVLARAAVSVYERAIGNESSER